MLSSSFELVLIVTSSCFSKVSLFLKVSLKLTKHFKSFLSSEMDSLSFQSTFEFSKYFQVFKENEQFFKIFFVNFESFFMLPRNSGKKLDFIIKVDAMSNCPFVFILWLSQNQRKFGGYARSRNVNESKVRASF